MQFWNVPFNIPWCSQLSLQLQFGKQGSFQVNWLQDMNTRAFLGICHLLKYSLLISFHDRNVLRNQGQTHGSPTHYCSVDDLPDKLWYHYPKHERRGSWRVHQAGWLSQLMQNCLIYFKWQIAKQKVNTPKSFESLPSRALHRCLPTSWPTALPGTSSILADTLGSMPAEM